jgi:hypothetical protein
VKTKEEWYGAYMQGVLDKFKGLSCRCIALFVTGIKDLKVSGNGRKQWNSNCLDVLYLMKIKDIVTNFNKISGNFSKISDSLNKTDLGR